MPRRKLQIVPKFGGKKATYRHIQLLYLSLCYSPHAFFCLVVFFKNKIRADKSPETVLCSYVTINIYRGVHNVLTYIEYRAVSGVFRTIDPLPPLHPASVSSPRTKGGGRTHSSRKTPDIGLASYSIIPLRWCAIIDEF